MGNRYTCPFYIAGQCNFLGGQCKYWHYIGVYLESHYYTSVQYMSLEFVVGLKYAYCGQRQYLCYISGQGKVIITLVFLVEFSPTLVYNVE